MFTAILSFSAALVALWFAAGLAISGVERFAKNTAASSFAVSALILGVLTSFSEMSVGINAVSTNNPELYVGNLIGGAAMLLLTIIPLLTIVNGGLVITKHIDQRRLLFFFALVLMPSITILDGYLTRYDAAIILVMYGVFLYTFQKQQHLFTAPEIAATSKHTLLFDLSKLVLGASIIFFSGNVLVDSATYFSTALGVPELLVSLLLLSLGTNLPEITIAVRSASKKQADIAFGDYIGSASVNPLLFAIFTLIVGPFTIATTGFTLIFIILCFGYGLFYWFARSKGAFTIGEAVVLLLISIICIGYQVSEIAILAAIH